MKKLSTFTLLMLSLMLLSITSCKDDDDTPIDPINQLPQPTQTGENTFGYLVNGEAIDVSNTRKITAIYQQNQLQLGGGLTNNNIDIDMFVGGPLEENISYSLVRLSKYTDFNIIDNCRYDIEDAYQGSIIFSNVDNQNFILSGTFEFSTVTDGCKDIKITEGRFDVKYTP